MATSRERRRLIWLAAILASGGAIAIVSAELAFASQGPGVAAGSASALTQTMMAIVVYGASALVVASGLIGDLRPH